MYAFLHCRCLYIIQQIMLEKERKALHNSIYGNDQITQYLQLNITIGADLNGTVQLGSERYD